MLIYNVLIFRGSRSSGDSLLFYNFVLVICTSLVYPPDSAIVLKLMEIISVASPVFEKSIGSYTHAEVLAPIRYNIYFLSLYQTNYYQYYEL